MEVDHVLPCVERREHHIHSVLHRRKVASCYEVPVAIYGGEKIIGRERKAKRRRLDAKSVPQVWDGCSINVAREIGGVVHY